MRYKDLTERELLELADTQGLHNEKLNEEWVRRYGINFPYKLTKWNTLLNCLSLKIVRESECDKLVLKQAHELLKKRSIS